MAYLNYNANPDKRKTCDCVIRAIATATGESWFLIYNELSVLAYNNCLMPNDPKLYEKYLLIRGFNKVNVSPKPGEKRLTVAAIAREYKSPGVVQVAKHLVAIDGKGNYVDTWDCGAKCAYKLWIKP